MNAPVDPEALLAALILAPRSYSRNRFFWLFETPEGRRVRRRAARVRSVLRQLVGTPTAKAEIIGERVLEDGQVHLRYRVQDLLLTRTLALSALEAATLRYALSRTGQGALTKEDRVAVERALSKLNHSLGVEIALLEAERE